jgi:cell division transport system permease protein
MKTAFVKYFFRQALTNIADNRMVHLVGIGTIAIAFLIFNSFVLVYVNINHWTDELGKSLTMSIYNKFVSKEEAMKALAKEMGDKAGLLSGLHENPLPASLEIIFSIADREDSLAYDIKSKLEKMDIVDEVQYSQEWTRKIKAIMGGIKLIGSILGGLLFLATLFIITNTIKLTVFARKNEIEILRLVGATNLFIKTPFLIEGSIQGLLGGLAALMILFTAYMTVIIRTDFRIGFATLDVVFISPYLTVFLLLMSVIIGFVGSSIALGRFFRT